MQLEIILIDRNRAMETPIKDLLFRRFKGCSSNCCVVRKPSGMGTNGPCTCKENRGMNAILWQRASKIDSLLKDIKK